MAGLFFDTQGMDDIEEGMYGRREVYRISSSAISNRQVQVRFQIDKREVPLRSSDLLLFLATLYTWVVSVAQIPRSNPSFTCWDQSKTHRLNSSLDR